MSARQVIPDAAVEAMSNTYRDGVGVTPNEAWVRTLLEAAAPHIMAEAFEQGQTSGMRYASRVIAANKIGRPELPGPISPNPYR
jgi:hypothetical protein